MTDIHKTDIQAAIEAGTIIGSREILDLAGIPAVITPRGFTFKLHPELLDKPRRIEQQIDTETAASFIEYFNRFSDDHSAIFCDIDNASFKGIIDYHDVAAPAWGLHVIQFNCKKTPEWNAWADNNGEKMDQTDFAFFLEDNLEEIVSPPGAQMLEIVSNLKGNTSVSFTSSKRLSDGQTQLQYIEEHEGSAGVKGDIKIPETFQLGMRVFEGGEAYQINARFRYRITNGNIKMWYDLVRPHKVIQAAVEDEYQEIKQQTKCQLIIHGNT